VATVFSQQKSGGVSLEFPPPYFTFRPRHVGQAGGPR
jgi:hypothetical protein